MAVVKGPFNIQGSVKGVTFYTRTDSDKVIMRTKGGPSKGRIAKGAEFEKLRSHQQEWSACVQFARGVKAAVGDLVRLSDFNLAPAWTGMGKKLIGLDKESPVGERALRLSHYPQALVNYEMNRNNPFQTVLRIIPAVKIDKEKLQAQVDFPAFNTSMNLYNYRQLPYFRLQVSFGCVADRVYNASSLFYNYDPASDELDGLYAAYTGEWHSCNDLIAAENVNLQLAEWAQALDKKEVSVLLSVGIEFGTAGFGGEIEVVKRAGSAKIIAVL